MNLPLWKAPQIEWHWRPMFTLIAICALLLAVSLMVYGTVHLEEACARSKLQAVENRGYEQAQHDKLYARGYLRGMSAPLPERQ